MGQCGRLVDTLTAVKTLLRRVCLGLVLTSLISGCASRPERTVAAPPAIADARLLVFDGATGEPRPWDDLAAAASAAEVVIIGETHTPDAAQVVHQRLFDAVLAGPGGSTAAGALEFYERDHQADVDDFLGGLCTHEELVGRALGSPASDLPGHRAILASARRAGRPVIAANTPRRYASLARREGYARLEVLSPAQRALFMIPPGSEAGLPEGRYRDDFFAFMRGKPEPGAAAAAPDPAEESRLAATYRAQVLWDATMADSVVRAVDRGLRPVVLVVGRFHSDHRGGLVQMIERLRPGTSIVTTTAVPTDQSTLTDDDIGRADWVIYAAPSQPASN